MSAAKISLLALQLLLCLGLPFVGAKFISGSFHLDAGDFEHGPEYEMTKYSFNMGKAHISGKVTYPTADANWMTSPALYLFSDSKWGALVLLILWFM
jgi:hypothetical protein